MTTASLVGLTSENHTGTLTELQMKVKLGPIRQFTRFGRYLPVAILFGAA